MVVDVTETQARTSEKKQKRFYSGKKKRHTLKSQVVVETNTCEIICTAHGKGRQHDFKLFKTSQIRVRADIKVLGDKGYQGIQNLHSLSYTPKKKPRGNELSNDDY